MATSLLKFSFKTSLVKSIISEISSNISKYYYAFGKSNPWFSIRGLTATLVENSNQVVLTNGGTTQGFLVGQLVTQTGGLGGFGSNAKISLIVNETTFEVNANHLASGDVVFSIDDESVVQEVSDLFEYEVNTRNNLILYKQIDSNDVAPVVIRRDWQRGYVYDMYREYSSTDPAFSGATALENAEFYVLTDQYNVYKCLDNNKNAPSYDKPTGVAPVPFTTDDGYIWKYMYTIPITLRNKFLSSTVMPVTTALTTQFYSKGSIIGYSIENPGNGYNNASYKITGFKIVDGGSYTGSVTITIEPPHQNGGVQATIASVVVTGGVITSIVMNNQGSGYSYPPIFTITGSTTREAKLEPILENLSTSYTNLIVSGDGRLEENPYVVDSIEIIDPGSGYESITLGFTNPDLPNGIIAAATVTCNPTTGAVTNITVTNEGYGYSLPFYSSMDDLNATNIVRVVQQTNLGVTPGSGFKFRVHTKKNEAELAAVLNTQGQIEQVKVLKPGIGYTYASVTIEADFDTVNDPQSGYEPASILLDFGLGQIETSQSTTEITAVPGAIYAIHVKAEGSDVIGQPNLVIEGDGVGATGTVEMSIFNTVSKINITNPGYGYTYATARLVDSTGNDVVSIVPPVLDVVLPPQGGHGKDAILELYSKTIMFHTTLFKDRIYGQAIANDFRQVCLIKNPKVYGKETYVRLGIGSSAQLVIGSNTQSADFNQIYVDDILTRGSDQFLVSAKYPTYTENSCALLLTYLSNAVVGAGDTIGKPGVNFAVQQVVDPQINKFTGEVLTIDNRVRFAPTSEQIVISSNTITF